MHCYLTARVRQHVERYDESHRTPGNRTLHFLGIPLLLVGALGLLSKVAVPMSVWPLFRPNLAWIALLGCVSWSIWLGGRIGVLSVAIYLGGYVLGSNLEVPHLVAIIAVGSIAHLVGHYPIERRPPAVLSRPVAVLEALPWFLATLAKDNP